MEMGARQLKLLILVTDQNSQFKKTRVAATLVFLCIDPFCTKDAIFSTLGAHTMILARNAG